MKSSETKHVLHALAFHDKSLDVALRTWLYHQELPKATEHIDQLLRDFAEHYHFCNSGLFPDVDAVHTVAFSLLLLQTDAHNPQIKRKMSKPQFLKRTLAALDGRVASEVIQVFYDNIVYHAIESKWVQSIAPSSSTWFSMFAGYPSSEAFSCPHQNYKTALAKILTPPPIRNITNDLSNSDDFVHISTELSTIGMLKACHPIRVGMIGLSKASRSVAAIHDLNDQCISVDVLKLDFAHKLGTQTASSHCKVGLILGRRQLFISLDVTIQACVPDSMQAISEISPHSTEQPVLRPIRIHKVIDLASCTALCDSDLNLPDVSAPESQLHIIYVGDNSQTSQLRQLSFGMERHLAICWREMINLGSVFIRCGDMSDLCLEQMQRTLTSRIRSSQISLDRDLSTSRQMRLLEPVRAETATRLLQHAHSHSYKLWKEALALSQLRFASELISDIAASEDYTQHQNPPLFQQLSEFFLYSTPLYTCEQSLAMTSVGISNLHPSGIVVTENLSVGHQFDGDGTFLSDVDSEESFQIIYHHDAI